LFGSDVQLAAQEIGELVREGHGYRTYLNHPVAHAFFRRRFGPVLDLEDTGFDENGGVRVIGRSRQQVQVLDFEARPSKRFHKGIDHILGGQVKWKDSGLGTSGAT